jgi:outer membrane protein
MQIWLKSVLSASLAAAVALSSSAAFADGNRAPTRVAVVDVQRAVMQTEEGLRAQANLKKLFDNRQQELNKKQQDLAKQKEDIEKQAKSISKEAYQKRAEEWQKQMMELQAVFVDYNKEIEKKQKEITDPIIEKLLGVIKRLAADEGYDLVVDRATVAFVRSEFDLTERCVQLYNQGKGVAPAK